MRLRPAELLEADVLAGDRLDDVGAGDEHVAGLVDHHGEVGDRRRVHRATGAGAHDERDLRDHSRGAHVAEEDLPVEAERDDALLDPRAARVVQADHGATDLHREVHDLDDLLAEHLAEGAAEHGEVLCEDRHLPAVDHPVAGHHPVAVGAVLLLPELGAPVPGVLVHLDERALVEQHRDPLPRGLLAPRVLLLDRPLRPRVGHLGHTTLEVGELARRGRQVDRCAPEWGPAPLPWRHSSLGRVREPLDSDRRCGIDHVRAAVAVGGVPSPHRLDQQPRRCDRESTYAAGLVRPRQPPLARRPHRRPDGWAGSAGSDLAGAPPGLGRRFDDRPGARPGALGVGAPAGGGRAGSGGRGRCFQGDGPASPG